MRGGSWGAQHDRVYSIFSRMVLEELDNLAVIGGDPKPQTLNPKPQQTPNPKP